MTQYLSAPTVSKRDRVALYGVNFFMADMEAGVGPFLGVLLQSRGWSTGTIGGVITLGAVVGMLTVTPAGALVDATGHKRGCVIVAGLGDGFRLDAAPCRRQVGRQPGSYPAAGSSARTMSGRKRYKNGV